MSSLRNGSKSSDIHSIPHYKSQEKDKAVLRNKAVSLSCASSTIKAAVYKGNKSLPSCKLKSKPNYAVMEGSSSPRINDNFQSSIEKVNIFGPDKVLLVKVLDDKNEKESLKGKLEDQHYSFESFGNKIVKLTSSRRIKEEKTFSDSRLGKRESDIVFEKSFVHTRCHKPKYVVSSLNNLAVSENVSTQDFEKWNPNPVNKVFNLTNSLAQSKDDTYQVKYLEDGCCSIKKVQESPELFKTNQQDTSSQVYKPSVGKQHSCNNNQKNIQRSSEKSSNSLNGCFSSVDDNDCIEDLLRDLCYNQGMEEIPLLDDECLFPSMDEDSTFSNSSNTADKCQLQNCCQSVKSVSASNTNNGSLRDLKDTVLTGLPEDIEQNDHKLKFLEQIDIPEHFSVVDDPVNLINGKKNIHSSILSVISCSEKMHIKTCVMKKDQIDKTDKCILINNMGVLTESASEGARTSCSHASNVVWSLQTPKPSVVSHFSSPTRHKEIYTNKMYLDNGNSNYCNLPDISVTLEGCSLPLNESTNEKCIDDLLKHYIDKEVNADTVQGRLVEKSYKADDSFSSSILGFDQENKIMTKLENELCSEKVLEVAKNEVHSNCHSLSTSKVLSMPELSSEGLSAGHSDELLLNVLTSDINSDVNNTTSMLEKDVNNHVYISKSGKSDELMLPSNKPSSMSEHFDSKNVDNSNEINNLLDSFFQEVEQCGIEVDNSNKSCVYSSIAGNISATNTDCSLGLLADTTNSETLIDDIFKTLDTGSFTSTAKTDELGNVIKHTVAVAKKEVVSCGILDALPKSSGSLPRDPEVANKSENAKSKLEGNKVKRTVSFKTRPANRPIKCVVHGQVVENKLQKQHRPLRFVLDKDRRLQNQDGSTSWPRREEFNPEQFNRERNMHNYKRRHKVENSNDIGSQLKPISTMAPTPIFANSIAASVTKFVVPYNTVESSKFVLPVGRTGLSISIPKNAPTSIASFLPPVATKCGIPSTRPAHILPSTNKSFSQDKVVTITSSVKSQTPSLVTNIPQQGNTVIFSQDAGKLVPTTVITQPMYQVTIPQTSPMESVYMMVPASSSTQFVSRSGPPSLVSTILPWQTSGQFCATNPVNSGKISSCTGKSPVTKYCLKSYVHPDASKSAQMKSASFLTAKVPVIFNTNTSGPVKILINTKSNIVSNIKNNVRSQDNRDSNVELTSEQNCKSEYVHSLRQRLLKKKPYPDFIQKKLTYLLRDELKSHLPGMPETILKLLDLPPQALRRGYFVVRDLKALRTEALRLHLGVIYREHVKVCTVNNCQTCFDFLQRKERLSLARKEQSTSSKFQGRRTSLGKGRTRGRGRKRRGGRAGGTNDNDPSYEPPQSFFNNSKRKFEDNQDKVLKIAKSGNSVEKYNSVPELVNEIQIMDNHSFRIKIKRSYSESDIHTLTEMTSLKVDRPRSCDDSYLVLYHTLKDSCRCQNLGWFGNFLKEQENKITKQIQVCSHGTKVEKRESFTENMLKTATYDLLLKKQLEKDYIPFSETNGGEQKQQQQQSSGVCLKPLSLKLQSLEIGPLIIAAKYSIFYPKLHVIYSARKMVYEFVIWPHHVKDKEQTVVEPPVENPLHLLLTIDVPFKSLHAISVNFNKVVLVVNSIPIMQVIGRRGISRFMLTEEDILSPAQRDHLSRMKAALTIYPLHKFLLLEQGKGQILHDGLCGFSTWFTQMLAQNFPIKDNHIPSWTLSSSLDTSFPVSELLCIKLQGHNEGEKCISVGSSFPWCPNKELLTQCSDHLCDLKSYSNYEHCNRNLKHETNKDKTYEPSVQKVLAEAPVSIEYKGQDQASNSSESSGISNCSGKLTAKSNVTSKECKGITTTSSSTLASVSEKYSAYGKSEEIITKAQDMLKTGMRHIDNSVDNNSTSGPFSSGYLVSAVKAALDSQGMLHSVPFNPALPFPLATCLEKGCNCEETCRWLACVLYWCHQLLSPAVEPHQSFYTLFLAQLCVTAVAWQCATPGVTIKFTCRSFVLEITVLFAAPANRLSTLTVRNVTSVHHLVKECVQIVVHASYSNFWKCSNVEERDIW
ncbi:uncharacterized protein [Cherax quadricarinatus]